MKNVHTEHCCIRHGCKYGDLREECTVLHTTNRQSELCDLCYDEGIENLEELYPKTTKTSKRETKVRQMYPTNVLKKYVRQRRRGNEQSVGVVMAFMKRGELYLGWSLCNKKDFFSKAVGTVVAYARACPLNELLKSNLAGKVPHTVAPELARMVDRAEKYFKI